MPIQKLTSRYYQHLLANWCGSEAALSANCAVRCGTPAGTVRYYPTLFRNLPRSIPPRPARTETGSGAKDLRFPLQFPHPLAQQCSRPSWLRGRSPRLSRFCGPFPFGPLGRLSRRARAGQLRYIDLPRCPCLAWEGKSSFLEEDRLAAALVSFPRVNLAFGHSGAGLRPSRRVWPGRAGRRRPRRQPRDREKLKSQRLVRSGSLSRFLLRNPAGTKLPKAGPSHGHK
jgi:hypothetical protein